MSSYFLCLVPTYVSSNYAIFTHAKYIDLDTLEYSVLDIRGLDADSLRISSRMQEVLKDRLGKEVYLPDRNSVDESNFELLGIPIDGFGYAISYPSGRVSVRESVLYFTDSVVWNDYEYRILIFYSLIHKIMHFAVSSVKSLSYKPYVEFNEDIVPVPSYYNRCIVQDSAVTRGTVNYRVKVMPSLFELKADNTGCTVCDKLQVIDKMPYSAYVVSPNIETLVIKQSVLSNLETLVIPNTVEFVVCSKLPIITKTKPRLVKLFISRDKHYTKPFLSYLLEWFSHFAQEDLTASEESSLSEIVGLLSKYVRVEFI